jgi:two-component system, NarL family, response regulator
MFRQHQPDVTLLDLRMPGMGGVEAAIAIRAEFPQAHMIALTTYGGDEDIRRALAAGVQAYLTKDVLHDELLKAIRAVHAGQTYLPAAVAAALAAQMPRPDLSAREVQVLELIVRGLANKQIAYSLSIAEHTVKNHVKSILSKLGVQDRTQAATAAIQRGIRHLLLRLLLSLLLRPWFPGRFWRPGLRWPCADRPWLALPPWSAESCASRAMDSRRWLLASLFCAIRSLSLAICAAVASFVEPPWLP